MEEFKIGDAILYRLKNDSTAVWIPNIYLGTGEAGAIYIAGGWHFLPEKYTVIPLTEATAKYIGTTQDIQIPWKPKRGELVAVKDKGDDYWKSLTFIEMTVDGRYRCSWTEDSCTDEYVPFDRCEPLYKHFKFSKNPEDKDA